MKSEESFVWADPPSTSAFPIARPGYPLIGAAAFATLIAALLGFSAAAVALLAATFGICGFFRDPDRVVPSAPGLVVSPADGKVIVAQRVEANPFIAGETFKISIFMSVFDVHVNRAPIAGRVVRTVYRPGRFLAAHRSEASAANEHNAVVIEAAEGFTACVVQVAGLIARRIVCRLQPGDALKRGQRYGMICFGSRLDLYLPPAFTPAVAVGDRVRAGTSTLGEYAAGGQGGAHG